ncbi:hypothetical protein [Silvibacterium sp.]|uniref:hypothetical protein n=1 Tax=Silvibacterium sp. TaxID=1964179 RepID=UPI0039E2E6F2
MSAHKRQLRNKRLQDDLKDWYEFHLLNGLNGQAADWWKPMNESSVLPRDRKSVSRIEIFLKSLHATVNEEDSGLGLSPAALGVEIPNFVEYANADLKRYVQFPAIVRDPASSEWTVEMQYKGGDKWENGAIAALLQLLRDKELWRIRQCSSCGKWIYVSKANQKFCSGTACRQKNHSQSESFKEKRADYMKKYRASGHETRAKSRN